MADGGIPEGVDPKLAEYIEQLVERRVAERVGAVETSVEEALSRLTRVEANQISDRASLLVFSGDMDRLMSAFIVASGAVAMGFEVSMYFTFWGLTALKKQTIYKGKSAQEKMVAAMLPGGPETVGTSRMNFGGVGPVMFKSMMKKQNVEDLPGLIQVTRELGVRMVACQMAMGVMGITTEELIDEIEYGGVATYLGDAMDSKLTLFF